MSAQINHVAIVSDNYAQLGKFYEAIFGMKSSEVQRAASAVTVGDGYVGLNITPRRAGGSAAHDPDGNVFVLSQKEMTNRAAIYVENDGKANPRHINHIGVRTMHPAAMAKFYHDVFNLAPKNKTADDPNHYLTDGHVTLVLMPWDITAYEGTGIITQGMDHIGFKVESIEALREDVERIAASNPRLAPAPMSGPEGKKLHALFPPSCPLGQHQMADCDGTLIDVSAE